MAISGGIGFNETLKKVKIRSLNSAAAYSINLLQGITNANGIVLVSMNIDFSFEITANDRYSINGYISTNAAGVGDGGNTTVGYSDNPPLFENVVGGVNGGMRKRFEYNPWLYLPPGNSNAWGKITLIPAGATTTTVQRLLVSGSYIIL